MQIFINPGSKISQPFIMLFHCTVAMGFLMGPVIIRPFFPDENPSDMNEVCHFDNITTSENIDNYNEVKEVINSIKWPFYITLFGHIFCAIGYGAVMMLPYEMPGR